MLSGFFGGLGLLLAAIGPYGLMSFKVTRRSREIAIRIAIGSPPSTVRRMVLREALLLAAMGLVVGIPCSLAGGKFISGILFSVSSHDPLTIGMVSLVLLGVATVAAVIPPRTAPGSIR